MVTDDTNRITYLNKKRNRSWSNRSEPTHTVVKPGLAVRKSLLRVWWDWKEVVCYQLLTFDPNLYSDCQQLDYLMESVVQQQTDLGFRKGNMFHQNYDKPHTSIGTRQKFRELNWEILVHPPYSTDLARSVDYLFLSTVNKFSCKKFVHASRKACENRICQFFFLCQ